MSAGICVFRMGEFNQSGIAMQGTIGGNPPYPQLGQRQTGQRKSIAIKTNDVDERGGVIQLRPRADGLTKNVDLPQLCVLPQATCGQPIVALTKLQV